MKTFLLSILILPIICFAQKKDSNDELIPYANIIIYNAKNTIGAEISYGLEVQFGLGYSINYENSRIGKKLSLHPSQYPAHIYQTFRQNTTSLYGTVGFKIKNKIILTGIVGYGQTVNVINAYDPTFRLSTDGTYSYKTKIGGGKQFLGLSIQYFQTPISPFISYDSFHGPKLGLGFLF